MKAVMDLFFLLTLLALLRSFSFFFFLRYRRFLYSLAQSKKNSSCVPVKL